MTADATPREFKELPLGLLDDPELPSRTSMDDTAMDELTSSIRANGLLQPIIAARTGDRFEVIAGHRRRIACARAGLVAAPCIIYPSKDAAHMAIQYAENRFREELNAADEALLFAELLERDCGGDVDVLCEKLGEKRGYVEGRLLLLRDEHLFEALRSGQITKIGIAQQLLKITDPHMRRYYLDAAIRGGATIAVVSGWVQEWQASARQASGLVDVPAPAAAPGAVPQMDYFRCAVCDGTDNVHLMVPINVHQHCKLAILDKLLATYKGVE
jgi:ParB family chromosome partitioning protein